MKKTFLLLCAYCLISFTITAQTGISGSFSIKGQVIDSLTNETIPYATLRISFMRNPQEVVKLLACDEDGRFQSPMSEAGEYIILLQSMGKLPAMKRFTLTENNQTLDLETLYMVDDSRQLGEVTVSAQRPLVRMEVDKLSYNLEEDPDAKVNNMLDMLRKVPLVTVDGNDEIQLKGSSNFKIYINGKPSSLMNNRPGDVLKSMPASSVKSIEVITDPGSRYDAEGVGGIINIMTTRNLFQGYTGTLRASASALGQFGGGPYLSAKFGKLGLTAMYNISRYNNPWNNSDMTRENLTDETQKFMIQEGRNKQNGLFQIGYLEASYEFDTLNLLNVGVNLYNGGFKTKSETGIWMADSEYLLVYDYNMFSTSKMNYGSTDINVDYQRSTRKKDELITLSYRFSNSPDDTETFSDITDLNEYIPIFSTKPWQLYPQWTNNNASTQEHTGQIDYTTPTWQGQTLEVGAKYIMRRNKSETDRFMQDHESGERVDITSADSHLKHLQHIYSGYLGYTLRFSKLSLKGGVRAEGTALDVKFLNDPDKNFNTDYFDIVPNATISYQINMQNQLRVGYNMRIQRPGIWYLNPYVNDIDPLNISYGNPNLDSERSNSVNINYSMFQRTFILNASLSYSFVDNAIEQYTFIDPEQPGVSQRTFGNIGKRQQIGGFLFASWNPIPAFRVYMNGGLDYLDLKSEVQGMANNGFTGRIYGGLQYSLPHDFRINVNGAYISPRVNLQGKSSGYHYTGLNIQKDFLKKNLTVSLNVQDPFMKTRKFKTDSTDPAFRMSSTSYSTARDFTISVSYRFGTLKEQIRRVQRGINNDDVKAGESGAATGGNET